MVAFSLRADGWYLRQDIIWNKPNPMPESVTDRCTKAHEYIFHLSKSDKYYFDQESIKQPVVDAPIQRMAQQIESQKGSDRVPFKTNGNMKAVGPGRNPRKGVDTNGGNQASEHGIPAMALNGHGVDGHSGYYDRNGNLIGGGMANKKSVWTVTTKPFKEAHFATFPEELIVDCIKAGCPEFICSKCGMIIHEIHRRNPEHGIRAKESETLGQAGENGLRKGHRTLSRTKIGYTNCGCNEEFQGGIVLDPFMGAGTTALVARKLNRNYVGFELNPEYIKIANSRLYDQLGMYK
jgi:DNA modification methylase